MESEFFVKTILSYYNKALNDGVVPSEWKDVKELQNLVIITGD